MSVSQILTVLSFEPDASRFDSDEKAIDSTIPQCGSCILGKEPHALLSHHTCLNSVGISFWNTDLVRLSVGLNRSAEV